jgi:peptidoglycan/LPS O-acetylase OafA/YrhL
MGKVSFSVYLLHMPIISTFGVFTFVIFSRYINEYTIAAILTSVVSILFTYMVALVYYKLVDSQGMKVSDSLANLVVSRGFWGKLVKAS